MPASYYRDALVVGVCGCAVLAGVHRLPDLAARFWPVLLHGLPATVPQVFDAGQPALYALAVAVTRSLFAIGLLALALGFASWYVRRAWQQALLLAVLALLAVPQWGSTGDFFQSAAIGFIGLAVIASGAQRIVRFNLLGYFLVVMLLLLLGPAADLLGQPNSFFRANGWVLVAAGVVLLLWPFAAWQSAAQGAARETTAGPLV